MLAPPRPRPPASDEPEALEALIREARARQRRRWVVAAVVAVVITVAAFGIGSIVAGRGPTRSRSGDRPPAAVRSGMACGVRVENMRIVDSAQRTIYREPGNWTPSYPHPAVVRCSGPTVWVVWDNGAAMNQEGYVGARSGDGGRTWGLVFAEGYFGVRAPHELDSYLGAWTLSGPRVAYFSGWCPVCGRGTAFGTDSLSVTKNNGRTFHTYKIPSLTGYMPVRIRVSGRYVTISGKAVVRGVRSRKTVTVHVA